MLLNLANWWPQQGSSAGGGPLIQRCFWEALVAADPAAASTADPPPKILHSGVAFTFVTPNSPKTSVCTAFFALSLKKT